MKGVIILSYETIPVNIKGILSSIEEATLKNADPFPFAGMWLFTGSQGNGKTLLMMHFVKQILEQCPKCELVSNISIYGLPSHVYTGIEDFEKYSNGQYGTIFVIDEIHTLFNSLESKNMPLNTMQVWCQNRKNRRLVLGTSQRFSRISKGIREQTTWNYECRPLIRPFLYSYRVKDGGDYNDAGEYVGEPPKNNFFVPNKSVMRMYNTLEVVKNDRVN